MLKQSTNRISITLENNSGFPKCVCRGNKFTFLSAQLFIILDKISSFVNFYHDFRYFVTK